MPKEWITSQHLAQDDLIFSLDETTPLVEMVWQLEIRGRQPARFLIPWEDLASPLCRDLSTHPTTIQCLPPSWVREQTLIMSKGVWPPGVVLLANCLSTAARMWNMPLMGINGYGTCYHSLRKKEAACALESMGFCPAMGFCPTMGFCPIGEDQNCKQWEGSWNTGQAEAKPLAGLVHHQ